MLINNPLDTSPFDFLSLMLQSARLAVTPVVTAHLAYAIKRGADCIDCLLVLVGGDRTYIFPYFRLLGRVRDC